MNLFVRSFQLDRDYFSQDIPFSQKIIFSKDKYYSLLKDIFSSSNRNLRSTRILGREYFYDAKYALGVLQGTIVDNDYLKFFIPRNSTVIDIGANIGQFNLFCRDFLSAKKILSFEPVPHTYDLLTKNVKTYTFPFAISSRKKLNFYLYDLSVWNSSHNVSEDAKEIVVKGMKLDEVPDVNKLKAIDLLKVDTEGAETDVLSTARKTLKKTKYVLVEVSVVRESGNTFSHIVAFLSGLTPAFELVRVGRSYNNIDQTTGAVDLLFKVKQINE